jgi:hypothetical protein
MKVKFENSIASLPHFKAGIMQQTLSFEVMKQNFKGKTTLEILWNLRILMQ